jgi:hypothetical protein
MEQSHVHLFFALSHLNYITVTILAIKHLSSGTGAFPGEYRTLLLLTWTLFVSTGLASTLIPRDPGPRIVLSDRRRVIDIEEDTMARDVARSGEMERRNLRDENWERSGVHDSKADEAGVGEYAARITGGLWHVLRNVFFWMAIIFTILHGVLGVGVLITGQSEQDNYISDYL